MATDTTDARAATGPEGGDVVDVRLEGVVKRFGDVTAVAGVDLDGLVAVVDPFSAPLLSGLILDYDGSIGGKGFEFRNPQVAAGCGCGRSFQVNEEALEALSAEG